MLAYLTILSTMLMGFGGAPLWTVAFGMVMLTTLSVMSQSRLRERAVAIGAGRVMLWATFASFGNALFFSGAAFATGAGIQWLLHA